MKSPNLTRCIVPHLLPALASPRPLVGQAPDAGTPDVGSGHDVRPRGPCRDMGLRQTGRGGGLAVAARRHRREGR